MKRSWKYYDYCHNPYIPIAPTHGKHSPDELFFNSIVKSRHRKQLHALTNDIKKIAGPWKTVWGVKLGGTSISWEFYFYNHQIKESSVSVANITKILRKHFSVSVASGMNIERLPYFMFSVDLNDNVYKSGKLEGLHLYIPGRADAFQGNNYFVNSSGFILENHYDFYRMPQDFDKFIHKVKHSIVLGSDHISFLKHELVRKLMPCYEICIANKTDRDGIYFSRINIEQLLYFMEWFAYPDFILDHVRTHKKKLDHMFYDVAFDCSLISGEIVFGKSSYYSVF